MVHALEPVHRQFSFFLPIRANDHDASNRCQSFPDTDGLIDIVVGAVKDSEAGSNHYALSYHRHSHQSPGRVGFVKLDVVKRPQGLDLLIGQHCRAVQPGYNSATALNKRPFAFPRSGKPITRLINLHDNRSHATLMSSPNSTVILPPAGIHPLPRH